MVVRSGRSGSSCSVCVFQERLFLNNGMTFGTYFLFIENALFVCIVVLFLVVLHDSLNENAKRPRTRLIRNGNTVFH